MTHRSFAALFVVLASPAALAAAPDLATSIAAPAGVHVDVSGRYDVTIRNVGNKDATGVTLSIQLPQTHTSPQVYVLGTLGAFDSRCIRSGTVLNCTIGQIRKTQSALVSFNIALPVSAAPIVFTATAARVTGETNTTNNTASLTASLVYENVAVAPPRDAVNTHCTGTGLTAYFECRLFAGSTSSHNTRFEANNTITFVNAPGYTGDWTQPSGDSLRFHYYDDTGALTATFNGKGVGHNCYEGLTVFPNSNYVSPYEVCLQ